MLVDITGCVVKKSSISPVRCGARALVLTKSKYRGGDTSVYRKTEAGKDCRKLLLQPSQRGSSFRIRLESGQHIQIVIAYCTTSILYKDKLLLKSTLCHYS